MRAVFINGSPKAKGSVSGAVLAYLRERLSAGSARLWETRDGAAAPPDLAEADSLVLAFPLYVDGLPGHLLSYLEVLERAVQDAGQACTLYAVVNCGFYEAKQIGIAMEMLQNWCIHAGARWGQGVSIGGGGMFLADALGKGPMTEIGAALDALCETIRDGGCAPDVAVHPNFPRRLYMAAAHYGWKKEGKQHGNSPKDLRGPAAKRAE